MDMCCDGHDEIVYETRNCPLCEMKEDLESTIEELQQENVDLNNNIEELQSTIDEYEEIKSYIKENYPDALI